MITICQVCLRPVDARKTLCGACATSYDRALARDATTAGIIAWAARRARSAMAQDLARNRARAER